VLGNLIMHISELCFRCDACKSFNSPGLFSNLLNDLFPTQCPRFENGSNGMGEFVLIVPKSGLSEKLHNVRIEHGDCFLHRVCRIQNESEIRPWQHVPNFGQCLCDLLGELLVVQYSLYNNVKITQCMWSCRRTENKNFIVPHARETYSG